MREPIGSSDVPQREIRFLFQSSMLFLYFRCDSLARSV
jgi:hypothetical protein